MRSLDAIDPYSSSAPTKGCGGVYVVRSLGCPPRHSLTPKSPLAGPMSWPDTNKWPDAKSGLDLLALLKEVIHQSWCE